MNIVDMRVLSLGLIQSLFESSMYMFVLEWTPSLSRAAFGVWPPPSDPSSLPCSTLTSATCRSNLTSTEGGLEMDIAALEREGHRGIIPHGFIFAAFMVYSFSNRPQSFRVLFFFLFSNKSFYNLLLIFENRSEFLSIDRFQL